MTRSGLLAAALQRELDRRDSEQVAAAIARSERRFRAAGSFDIADQLDDLVAICGAPLVSPPAWLRDAATLAAAHRLTFYDAAWAAAARGLGIPLVSADAKLIAAGLAESPAATAGRLRLR